MNEQIKEYGLMLNIHEAIKFSGLPKAQLYRLAREDLNFPVFRLKGRVFFNRDRLMEWLEDNTGNVIKF